MTGSLAARFRVSARRTLPRVVIATLSIAASATVLAEVATAEIPDSLEQRLAACAACHGKSGEGVRRNAYYPRIAGKPADYLFQQLVNFRNGRRGFPQMVYFVRHLSDANLREIADYYAALHPGYPPPPARASAATMARGAALVRHGDAARAIPACDACHGTTLTGMLPAIPGLVGLYPDYVTSQLGSWQRGIRHAAAPDCMATIASKLDGGDVVAIAAWLAAQPAPASPSPAPQSARKLPLACGSQQVSPQAAPTAQRALARGEYLARIGDCVACHTARGGAAFAGGRAIETSFGTFFAPNITPDPRHGIGNWSAGDFWRAMHDGRGPDGTPLYPVFPYPSYTRVNRYDADAIYAYLRSVAPVPLQNRAHTLRFPYSQRKLLLAWRALYFEPGESVAQPAESAQWNRGAYLVQGLGHCSACHAARNLLGATLDGRALAGGVVASQDWYAPSLAGDREAGLGAWEIADIVALLRDGVSSRGAVFGPMAQVVHDSLQYLTEADATAIGVYLKSLAGDARAAIPGPAPALADSAKSAHDAGAKIYDSHCKSCHQADGRGKPSAYPPLAGNASVTTASPVNPIRMLLFGGFPPSTAGNPRPYGMPPFAYTLGDEDAANVLTYVRTAWGNRGTAIRPTDVAPYRAVPSD
ncbi:MAG: c-type cytochrome [Betaproteobacteria bacterium]